MAKNTFRATNKYSVSIKTTGNKDDILKTMKKFIAQAESGEISFSQKGVLLFAPGGPSMLIDIQPQTP